MEIDNLKELLYLLLILPVIFILISGYKKKEKVIDSTKLNIRYKNKKLKIALMSIGIGLIMFALLNPKIFKGYKLSQHEGSDLYFIIDVSKSMLSEDIKPNRLTRSKEIIKRLIKDLKGDRIGFIPFSSSSYIQMPLTDDYDMAEMFLDVIDTNLISGGSTNIASAIDLAKKSFDESLAGDRIIILISDGEAHSEESLKLLNNLDKNIKIYSVGIGTTKGSLIPKEEFSKEYIKDQNGKYVNSRINSYLLKKIAAKTGGRFFLSDIKGTEKAKLIKSVELHKKNIYKNKRKKEYRKIYQIFLFLGILLFLSGYFLDDRRIV